MLMPKRTKYRKQFRGRMKGSATRGNSVQFEEFGLQALGRAWITSRQIEAARRAIVRYVRRGGKIIIRIFPDKPVTKKAAETRMGSGKGAVDHWVAVVKPGMVMFEMSGITEGQAREAFRLAGHKLPIPTQFVTKNQFTLPATEADRQDRILAAEVAAEEAKHFKAPAGPAIEFADEAAARVSHEAEAAAGESQSAEDGARDGGHHEG